MISAIALTYEGYIMTQTLNPAQNNADFLHFFQQYATECLLNQDPEVSEALRRRQIPHNRFRRLEETYKISFNLDSSLSLKSIKKQVVKQIEAAAYFIRDFQISVLGQHTSIFHLYEIEIQIAHNLRYAFKFDSGKLFIQLPYWQVNFLDCHVSYQQMKNRWNRGEHLQQTSPVREAWWLFNPIGEFRTNLRTTLLLAVQRQILGIDNLFVNFGLAEATNNSTLPPKDEPKGSQSFKDKAIAFLRASVNEDKLGISLEMALKNQDEKSLVQLLGLFKKNLADPGQIEELIDTGVFSLQEIIHEEKSKVDIKMFGFVNVGNYHRIDVALNLSSGYLKKYVELVPRKVELKAIQVGFVNVYTIDDITVKPNFHGAMKLNFEAAALERSLRELQLVE